MTDHELVYKHPYKPFGGENYDGVFGLLCADCDDTEVPSRNQNRILLAILRVLWEKPI